MLKKKVGIVNNQNQHNPHTIVEDAIINYIMGDPYPSDTTNFNREDIYKCIRTLLENQFQMHSRQVFIGILDDLVEAGQIEIRSGGSPYYRLVEGECLFLRLKVERYKKECLCLRLKVEQYEKERHRIAQMLHKAARKIDPKPLSFIRRNRNSST